MENVPVATDAVMTGECVELKEKNACMHTKLPRGWDSKEVRGRALHL